MEQMTSKKIIGCRSAEKEYEQRAKALSDERSRLKDAEDTGILKVVRSLLSSGMPIHEVAKHTPYTTEELSQRLKKDKQK